MSLRLDELPRASAAECVRDAPSAAVEIGALVVVRPDGRVAPASAASVHVGYRLLAQRLTDEDCDLILSTKYPRHIAEQLGRLRVAQHELERSAIRVTITIAASPADAATPGLGPRDPVAQPVASLELGEPADRDDR